MTFEEFHSEMDAFWDAANREADELKDSMLALDRLTALYRDFDGGERQMADRVLAEWVRSPEEGKRFDAMAVIREFGIESAVPALRELHRELGASDDPGTPFERQKVEGLLAELGADGAALQ